MLKRDGPPPRPQVTVVEDDELSYRLTISGRRAANQPCQLTLTVNGGEPLSLMEDGGNAAPRQVMVDLRMNAARGRVVQDALSTEPWHHPSAPIIVYSRGERVTMRRGGQGTDIAYLVRNGPVDDLIARIRNALDIEVPEAG